MSYHRTFVASLKKADKLCVNCVFYTEHKQIYPFKQKYDHLSDGYCSLFGKINMVTGIIQEYRSAKHCRKDETKCSHEGRYYLENKP